MNVPNELLRRIVGEWIVSVSDEESELIQSIAYTVGTGRMGSEDESADIAESIILTLGAPLTTAVIGMLWTRIYYRTTMSN